MVAIRKGDVVVIVANHRDYAVGQQAKERTTYELAVCASATRDGVVKTVQHVYKDGDGYCLGNAVKLAHWERCMLIEHVDKRALLSAYADRRWHDQDTGVMPRYFDTVDECRDFARAFRTLAECGTPRMGGARTNVYVLRDDDMTDRARETVDDVLTSYVACALWSSIDDDDEPMDAKYGAADLADDTVTIMRADVIAFLSYLDDMGIVWRGDVSTEQMGHDLWLTRNGHGAGFWDRGLGDLGDALTRAAKSMGSCDLYAGDDGRIYAV